MGDEPEDPVLYLQRLSDGPLLRLDDFRRKGRPAKRITIGRSPNCHIVVDDGKVSAHHCLLLREGNRLLVQDSRSKNQTEVTGVTLTDGQGEIRAGNVIKVGIPVF